MRTYAVMCCGCVSVYRLGPLTPGVKRKYYVTDDCREGHGSEPEGEGR